MKIQRNNLHEIPVLRPACVAWQRVRKAFLRAPSPPPVPGPAGDPPGIVFPPVPLPTVQRIPGRNGVIPFPKPDPSRPLVFSHSGKIGDVVLSLPFCRTVAAAAGRDRFRFHLKTGTVAEKLRPGGFRERMVMLDAASAELVRPLLERQPFVESVSVSGELPEGALDLDLFRVQDCLPLWGGSLPLHYLPLAPWLVDAPDLSRPWLFGGRAVDLGGRSIALFATERFRRPGFSFSFLEPFRDEILFLGSDAEHSAFERAFFPVGHRRTADFAEALDVLSSVRLAIDNQTGLFAVAEALKIPRLLLVSDRDPNVIPCGGAFQFLNGTAAAKEAFLSFRARFCR